jgi:hypothetical protein
MRTKILLIAAATFALGVVASNAQVYSANVVGYVSLSLTNGFNLIDNPLDLDGTGTNNTVVTAFGTQLPNGSHAYAFAGGAFISPAASYTTKGGWGGGTNAVNTSLSTGQGVFVQVPSTTTVTMVGNVRQGTLSTPYSSGYNIVSSQVPIAGLLQTTLGYQPANGDHVYVWNPVTQAYNTPASSYTTKGGWGGGGQPNLSVGQAIFLQSASLSGGTWTTNFTVQ